MEITSNESKSELVIQYVNIAKALILPSELFRISFPDAVGFVQIRL